ncbi:hypothetical protein Nos7107_0862 [Nostoc sp. PCC 7107]|nr:hypothetical protein Nos7107_0862 [Nostoc sp. PCC 7107]
MKLLLTTLKVLKNPENLARIYKIPHKLDLVVGEFTVEAWET